MIPTKSIVFLICVAISNSNTAIPEDSKNDIVINKPQQVYNLPGSLNDVSMLNSNSPEIVKEDGIIVSTFPPDDKKNPTAHLNFPFEGRFDLFAHHINNQAGIEKPRTLYICALVKNASNKKTKLRILKAASYLSQPDAPFIELDKTIENPYGDIYAGPGDRVMTDFLLNKKQINWPNKLVIRPNETKILFQLPITLPSATSVVNGRSALFQLYSSKPVYVATLALFANKDNDGNEIAPALDDWQKLLTDGNLAGPREEAASIPITHSGKFKYGRVAGVQHGDKWTAVITDNATDKPKLHIPESGSSISFPLVTDDHGTFGTGQIQSAPLVVRYPDTAYQAHGNYGVEYDITMPLYNNSQESQTVTIKLQTPIKSDTKTDALSFFEPLPKNVFFRGTVELKYRDDNGKNQERHIHLVQKRGQQGDILAQLKLKADEKRIVKLRFFYPPDCTPPQVLTIETLQK